jgi:hypothetical protein
MMKEKVLVPSAAKMILPGVPARMVCSQNATSDTVTVVADLAFLNSIEGDNTCDKFCDAKGLQVRITM